MKYAKHPMLPKAPFFQIRFLNYGEWRLLKTRGANYFEFWFWRFNVIWRRPWLSGPARQLHPELFGLDSLGNPK